MSCIVCCFSLLFAAYAFVIMVFKNYFQGGKYTKDNKVDGKVVIVTGSNCGIGKETARELAKRGATVYMACRDAQRSQEARDEIVAETKNERVYCRTLDLASLESIRQFVDAFKKEETKLDILINNAGLFGPPIAHTKEGFDTTMGVNHLGVFYLTNLLLDLLKASAPSRIVVVASMAHKFAKLKKDDLDMQRTYSSQSRYNQTKLANILFARELAKRLEGTGVTVNSLHPGVVDSGFFRNVGMLNTGFAKAVIRPMYKPFFKTSESGAQTTIYAAIDPDLENISGQYFSDCAPAAVTSAAKDDAMAKWLWEESEKLTKLNA